MPLLRPAFDQETFRVALLCACRERPRRSRTAEQSDRLPFNISFAYLRSSLIFAVATRMIISSTSLVSE
jgi:hypothetical protein